MKHRREFGLASAAALCLLGVAVARADTLVMKDGRRVDGQLVAVRDGIIEFEGQRGVGGLERLRVDRADVRRIEFDDLDRDRRDRGDRDFRDAGGDRSGSFGSRPPGMRERDLTVNSAVAWNDTGIDVRAGQTIYFSASGRVRWGPNRQDGPEGEHNSPFNAHRPIPNRPAAALIGRIGDSNDYFFIGDEKGPIQVRASGRLYLGVNDDFLLDNSGAFRVVVSY